MEIRILLICLSLMFCQGCNVGGFGFKLAGQARFKVVDAVSQEVISDARVFADGNFYQPCMTITLGMFSSYNSHKFERNCNEGFYSVNLFINAPGIVYVMAGEEHKKNMEFSKIVPFYYPRDFDKDGVMVIKLTEEERR